MPETSIADTRKIITAIRQKYDYDLSTYSLSSLRYRLDKIISKKGNGNPDLLIQRLIGSKSVFDDFLFRISSRTTELFRDPEMWVFLKKNFLKELKENNQDIVVWLPNNNDPLELMGIYILLDDLNHTNKSTIYCSSISEKGIHEVKQGVFNEKTLELSLENYKKTGVRKPLSDNLTQKAGNYYLPPPTSANIIYFTQKLFPQDGPENLDLIIFRNKLLDFTIECQHIIIEKLIKALRPGGYIVFGTGENPFYEQVNKVDLNIINEFERIYQKPGES